ncbi:MAG: AsnC family transcriptional regulator [Rhodobacterales bacterium]|nr:MAG: AsnC family transcriptional regulator [Rhodobacterales bacterium]
MDDTDKELLRLLSMDSRRPAAELARVLGVSRATVQNRIDRLKTNGTIKRFTLELGVHSEQAFIEALVLVSMKSGDSRKTIDQLKRIAEVESLSSANGAYDLIVELRVSSLQLLDRILQEIRGMPMISETISSIRLNRFR